jgi:nitrite reductase/ring-hydroxylating ferredoxin subunit
MAEFKKALTKSELQPGMGKTIQVNGQDIAVFNVDGNFYAINNTCAHRGGPLGEGDLSGKEVACPWHGWTYDVTTGNATHKAASVACYPVKIEGEDVLIGI